MLEQVIRELGNYKWFIVGAVIATVVLSAYLMLSTKEFEWTKRKVRAFAFLYDLDTRGRICLVLLLFRLMFLIFLAATGGSTTIWEAVAVLFITLVYAIVSGENKNYLQLLSYAVIYVLLVMEGLFTAYYEDIDDSWLIMFLIIAFGLFSGLYSIHQSLTGYEMLLNTCAARDRMKYDKGRERTKGRKLNTEEQ